MDKLTTLAISYPDFQLNQIIDPEQMDLNNLQIVNKINNIIKSFNELIQGTSGAGNITIAPIPEFSDATTVQQALQQIATFVKTLDADAKRQFAELVQKNSQQDTEIQSIKSVNTQQDSRLQSLESTQANHTQRIGAIEQKNTSQDNEINAIKQKNNEQDGRLTTAEGTISTHTSQIGKVQEKDVEQDRRLSEIESREILDDKFVENVEKRVKANEGEIKQIKQDLDALEATDPSLEVTLARTSGHTQQTYNSIGKRLDSIEIPIQKDFEGKEKGNVNFRIVSEDTTAVWENDVKLGDLNSHNEDPTAHAEMMAVHEMDDTAHGDIREVLKTHTHTKSQITDFAHTHTKSEISDFPTSLPANGGNSDTVDGFHAYQLQCLQNTGSPYGDRWLESKWNGSYFNTYSTNASGEVLGLNVANADTVDGKHASDFAPKVNTTLEGTTTIRGKLINEDDIRIMSVPFANWCPNSTFRYNMQGWNYKQGSGTWRVALYPQIGSAVSCSISSGLSYIDHRGTTFYGSPGIELFISFWAHTSGNTTGDVKVELVSSKTNNLVADSRIPNNKGWTFYRFSHVPSELGDYYIRLVTTDTNESVYFSKIKVEHYGYSQWCERDADVIEFGGFGGGDVAGKTYVKATRTVENTGNPNSNLEVINYSNSKGGVCKISQYGSAKMQIIVDGTMVLDGVGNSYSKHEFSLYESYGELPTYPFKNNIKVVDKSSNVGTRVYTAHFYVNA